MKAMGLLSVAFLVVVLSSPLVREACAGSIVSVDCRIDLRASEIEIRNELLKATPIGSSAESVLTFVTASCRQRWRTKPPQYDVLNPALERDASGQVIRSIGSRSVKCHLGSYGLNPFARTHVFATWGFSTNDTLVGLVVRKEVDAP